ncbi:MAG: TRAP transporter substrate-binding protein DctP, partial [Dehalococcoidia bacterium]|nr:TRAP transporter substrate-binding protein DctP [Dehalococcoidia bacterium]
NFIPEYSAEQLWFVLNPETTEKLWKETDAGKKVIAAEQDKLKLKIVGWIPLGPNAVFSRSPITKLEDFKGKKARYLSKPAVPFYSALGMTYVSVPTEEVYTALQNGMIDVLTTSAQPMKNSSWWDYAKYGVLPYLGWYTGQVAFNADWWAALPKDLQDKVLAVGQDITKEAFDAVLADATAFYGEFKAKGGTVTTLSAEEVGRIQLQLSEQGAFEEIKGQIGADLWQAIRQVSGTKMK